MADALVSPVPLLVGQDELTSVHAEVSPPVSLSALGEIADAPSIAAVLELVCTELGMEVAYVSEVVGDAMIVELVSGDAESFGLDGGITIPREDTFCQRVLDGRLPNLISDARADPRTAALSATAQLGIGAYAGVPLTFSDGRLYGTLGAVSHERVALDDRALQFLRVLARLIGDQLEHEITVRELGRFAALVNEAGDGIMAVTIDGAVTSWNPACERIYGYTAEQAVGRSIVDLIVVPGNEEELRQKLSAVAGGESIEAETRRRRADGSIVDVSVTLAPIRTDGGEVSFISAVIRDVSAHVRQARFRAMERAVIAALADAGSASEAAAGTMRVLGQGLRCDFVTLWEPDADGQQLRCTARWIREGSLLAEIAEDASAAEYPRGSGLPGRVLESTEPIWIEDLRETARTPRELAAAEAGVRTVVAIPLVRASSVVGVVEFCSCLKWHDSRTLTGAGQAVLARLADSLGWHQAQEAVRAARDALEVRVRERTDELQRTLSELEKAQIETVHRLSRAVEFRDEDTGEHIARMSAIAGRIARGTGLDADTCALIELATPLHDVGKVAIPDSVLLKPGPLTPEERSIIETHAEIGYQLLTGSDSAILTLAAEIARTHHEHYDGRGYPHGLAGEAIPIAGRIAAIADVYDALTSDRVYRPAMCIQQALALLEDGRDTHFDPVLLDTFLSTR